MIAHIQARVHKSRLRVVLLGNDIKAKGAALVESHLVLWFFQI